MFNLRHFIVFKNVIFSYLELVQVYAILIIEYYAATKNAYGN